MSVTVAPGPWQARIAREQRGWRFGRETDVDGAPGLRWLMRRNCSMAPRQLLVVYLSMCAVSLGIAVGFWIQGAPVVMAFAGVELLVIGLALLVYGRHAADRETITLACGRMQVECWSGPRVERAEFRSAWVRIEPAHGQGSLVELSGDGHRMCVGRYLRPELRVPLADELRRAVRGALGSAGAAKNSGTESK